MNPLITTMIGVIVGGIISFWTNIHIINKQQKVNTSLEDKKERKLLIVYHYALLMEIQHNLVLCRKAISIVDEDKLEDGMKLTTGYFTFQDSVWETTKSQIISSIEEADILSSLFCFYYQTRVFNATEVALTEVLINYDETGVKICDHIIEITKQFKVNVS